MKLSYRAKMLLLVSMPALLAGCAAKPEREMQLEEKFGHRINSEGVTEFAFGLVWQMGGPMEQPRSRRSMEYPGNGSPPSGDRNGRRGTAPQMESGDYPGQMTGGYSFGRSLSNEEKLALEDKAVAALNGRLLEENLCPEGHQLDDLIWESNRIRLMGHCL